MISLCQIDHFLNEFSTRFSTENQVGMRLLQIIPGHIQTIQETDLDEIVAIWESDLTHPRALANEVKDWLRKWHTPR